jgi:hypothetical protein
LLLSPIALHDYGGFALSALLLLAHRLMAQSKKTKE